MEKLSKVLCSFSLLMFFSLAVRGQFHREIYCECSPASKQLNKESLSRNDSVYARISKLKDSIEIVISNPTNDTVYLFRSYFNKEFTSSKYLHRLDKKNKTYKISFLPFVSRLYVNYSDKVILGGLLSENQVVYDFIKLPPMTETKLLFNWLDLFVNDEKKNNVSRDFDVKKLNKYSKSIPFKFETLKFLSSTYKLKFEFAVYKSVNLICNKSAFYMQEAAFDKQSKEFDTLSVYFN